jgi:hypothetical protein
MKELRVKPIEHLVCRFSGMGKSQIKKKKKGVLKASVIEKVRS